MDRENEIIVLLRSIERELQEGNHRIRTVRTYLAGILVYAVIVTLAHYLLINS